MEKSTHIIGKKMRSLLGAYNRTYSLALRQAKFYLPWHPAAEILETTLVVSRFPDIQKEMTSFRR